MGNTDKTLTYSELAVQLLTLGLRGQPAIAHASLKALGHLADGPEGLLGTVLDSVGSLIMPTFTYKTMVTPPVGPPNNALTYGSDLDANRMAEPFRPNMPADPLMGILPETLRRHPQALRTRHPILSFSGIRAESFLNTQTLLDPLAPIGALTRAGGWVLLLGVDHTVNTSIHYAELLAGRQQFTRWALNHNRITECPGFPGCSLGFQDIALDVDKVTRKTTIGNGLVRALPLQDLISVVVQRIEKDPFALLCDRQNCERCQALKTSYG